MTKADIKKMEAVEKWLWRQILGIKWSDKVRNGDVLQLVEDKKAVLSQENRVMPQLFFSVQSSPTTFITSLRVVELQKPGFTGPNIPTQNRI